MNSIKVAGVLEKGFRVLGFILEEMLIKIKKGGVTTTPPLSAECQI